MAENKPHTSSLDRQVRGYPNPKYHTLVVNFAKQKDISQSEVVCDAIKLYFDTMPTELKNKLLKEE